MTPESDHDVLLASLARLTLLVPDSAHATRVRSLCRDQLERRARHANRQSAFATSLKRAVVPTLLGALAVFYAAVLIGSTLRVDGLL